MKKFSMFAAFAAFSLGTSLSFADTVATKDGSKLVGKITQIDGKNVVLKTDAAGDVKIKIANIVSLSTDAPINVRQNDGAVAQGTAAMRDPGAIVLITAKGPVNVNMGNISETWAAGAKDPEVVKRERHWKYEAGMDITGKSGNTTQIGTSLTFRATLQSSFDTLQLFTAYNRQVTNKNDGNGDVTSIDLFRAGADYQDNFLGHFSWYVRDEGGFDHTRNVRFYNYGAAGFGYDMVKTKVDTLTFRVGLSYRYENYKSSTPPSPNLSALGPDFALIHTLTMKTWKMVNRLGYTPAFNDFLGNYQIAHESYVELPLANPHWKFRVGMANNYNSLPPFSTVSNIVPAPRLKRLDTTYYARLLLTW